MMDIETIVALNKEAVTKQKDTGKNLQLLMKKVVCV